MSTNYYAEHEDGLHIGKSYYDGKDRGVAFAWDMEPSALEGVTVIVDEYGETLTRREFTAILTNCAIQDFEYLGMNFS